MDEKGPTAVLLCCAGDKEDDGTAFVRFMNSVPSLVAVDDAMGCIFLRWATAECGKNKPGAHQLEGENSCTAMEDWFGVIRFESVLSPVRVIWANIAVHSLTAELSWNRH